jgi:hypothetical protein
MPDKQKERIMFVANENRKEVVKQYPSAVKIVKVCCGYMVFEFLGDYETWKNQK